MIQSSDIRTVKTLRELLNELPQSEKPVVIWVGAGASSWCGYKRWEDMAKYFHDTYRRYEAKYNAHIGAQLIDNQDFPGLFDLCKCANYSRYSKMLTDSLSIRQATPLFKRFCAAISRLTPVHVLTTNVDEMLEKHIELLFDKTKTIPSAIDSVVSQYTRSLLLRPEIRRLLGVSEGNPVNSLTRWNVFPVIRLATVVKIGLACSHLGIASTKLDFGAAMLAGTALATVGGQEWVDDVAGYVLCGRSSVNLGSLVMADPSIIEAVLRFRETAQGISIRSEIFSPLSRSEAADAFVAVNAALHEAIPLRILQSARDRFIEFRTPNSSGATSIPSLWNDQRYSDQQAISKWRIRSRQILDAHIEALKLDHYSECPCGSGDKLKFCCEAALK